MSEAPVDNLVRANYGAGTASLRADDDDGGKGRTMFGHFAVFDQWTEIDSWYEGQFMERVKRGAFKQTFKDRAGQIRVMYAHGRDPSIGDKPLGAPDVLREDADGAYYESELFDASYVNDLIPALRADQLGASFRFTVDAEQWVEPKKASDSNPKSLKERTITAVSLYELGPCPWGAYAGATAGVRSGTDDFIESLLNDPVVLARFIERTGPNVAGKFLASLPTVGRKGAASEVPAVGGSEQAPSIGMSPALARARLALLA